MGIFERNEYIPHGNDLVPFFNGERILNIKFHTLNGLKAMDSNVQKY